MIHFSINGFAWLAWILLLLASVLCLQDSITWRILGVLLAWIAGLVFTHAEEINTREGCCK